MDILDIDEIEDDFGIFEEKIQDDVTNILKQWKIGNTKRDAIFDSRTFTRPKGSIIRNSIDGSSLKSHQIQENQNGMCMKIGGLVSNIQKSFLNEISPPNSLTSSINFDNETMSNSLITSADFSNINFFNTSFIDTNIDIIIKNNLKHYKKIEHENRSMYEKNIPNDIQNDFSMKSSVSKDNQQYDNSKKFELEENLNLLTDSTKENSPKCHHIEDNSSSFQNITQEKLNTFTNRNSTIIYDNTINNIKSEFDKQSSDPNKTFLKNSKIEPELNKTYDQIIGNSLSNNINKTQNLNETHILKSVGRNKTFDSHQSNLEMKTSENVILPMEEKILNSFEKATSTPQKNFENEVNLNIDFSPITPFNTNKLQKTPNEESVSVDEKLFDITENIYTENTISKKSYKKRHMTNNIESCDLDIDNFSDNADKIENFKENAMKKSLETIKKRYSHKFDKTPELIKTNIQKISNPFPENCRLLSRRSRLNDDLGFDQDILNETQNRNQNIENEKKGENCLNFLNNDSKNIVENEILNSEPSENEKDLNDDEKDINTKKKHETKRLRNDDRFKTIKINKPFTEHYKEEIENLNEIECRSPNPFSRIDNNVNIINSENDHIKLEKKIKHEQLKLKEKLNQGSIKNLKYERISKIENLGKAISASNLDHPNTEQCENFKFSVPAPVQQLKSPMGIKAKSFHNLASNNFGFGFKKPSSQVSTKYQENNISALTNSKNLNTKNYDSSCLKTPILRSTNQPKRTGLLRPSSGYFSRGPAIEANFKDCEKDTKVDYKSTNSEIIKTELSSTIISKPSKLTKPTDSRLPTNIKRSGLPRPSVYYKK